MSTLKMSDEDFEKNMEFISQNFGPALADSFRARDAGQRTALAEATKLLTRANMYPAMDSEDKRNIGDFLRTQRPQPTNFCGTLELAAELNKPQTAFERGVALAKSGGSVSDVWGACKDDSEMPEVHRGLNHGLGLGND